MRARTWIAGCLTLGVAFIVAGTLIGTRAQSISSVPGVTQQQLLDLMPQPADTVPPVDVYGGALGAQINKYVRADAARPRITRSMLVTLDAAGTANASWSAQPLAAGAVVTLTPIYSGSGIPKCWATAAASTTGVPIKCTIESGAVINLSIVTSGLTLNTPANGMQVNVVALPASQ